MVIIQGFLNYGTAYRLTKAGGDNGISLFGWFLLLGLASLIPGLGIYLWSNNRETGDHGSDTGSINQTPDWMNPGKQKNIPVQDGEGNEICPRCSTAQRFGRDYCMQCNLKFSRE